MTEIEKKNGKVAIIGAGYVGAQVTYTMAMRNVAKEIVLIDINEEKAHGEAKDIRHGLPFMDTTGIRVGDYNECADCDLIIISAGRGRKPGETRLDLTHENIKIMESVTDSIKQHYTRGAIMVISNPVDILTLKVTQWMGLPEGLVFGTGCILDTSRFLRTVADTINVDITDLDGYMIGAHGEFPVPVWSKLNVNGTPIEEYCRENSIEWNEKIKSAITDSTKKLGAEIIAAKGRTDFGISTCVCRLADAIINNRPINTPVSSLLNDDYGIKDIALSIPSQIDASGITKITDTKFNEKEFSGLLGAADMLKNTVNLIENL